MVTNSWDNLVRAKFGIQLNTVNFVMRKVKYARGRKNILAKNARAQGMFGILLYVQTTSYQRRCELDKLVEAMRAKFLKQEIELLKAQVKDQGTGHIRTAISVLKKELEKLED
jgi:RNA binding exosome subunit